MNLYAVRSIVPPIEKKSFSFDSTGTIYNYYLHHQFFLLSLLSLPPLLPISNVTYLRVFA